ncbi:MAG TPA: hypothetical protein VJ741_12820 [Solirubrobacteraceae bacterium]|nr:hypothetical protein [Solirubrobacteraceae bacterium]
MSSTDRSSTTARLLSPLTNIGGRVAAGTLRPLAGVAGIAAGVGIGLERRAVERVLDSDELERVLNATVNSAPVQSALVQATQSEAVDRLVDGLFESGVVDRLMDRLLDSGALDRFLVRLLSSEGLWRLIDEIAASPAVTAAISQQGLSFADQVGEEMRGRSRRADDWVERAARRLIHRQPTVGPTQPQPGT